MRRDDWPERLAEHLVRVEPFAWGSWDCCTFAADAVLIMTGSDPMAGSRGYRDAAEAKAALRGKSLYHTLLKMFPRVHPAMARRGDLVLFATDAGPMLTVCAGEFCVAPGERGPVRLPSVQGRHGFRVN